MRCVLRRKTGELVATIVTKRAFTISLADHGLQDLHVVLTMHVEEPPEPKLSHAVTSDVSLAQFVHMSRLVGVGDCRNHHFQY